MPPRCWDCLNAGQSAKSGKDSSEIRENEARCAGPPFRSERIGWAWTASGLDRVATRHYLTNTLIAGHVKYARDADPTRRAILARLVEGEATVNELAQPFDISLPAVSRHLKVLEHAGLIWRGRAAQWRPCKLEVKNLVAIDDWLASYRRFWEESFDKMATYLDDLQHGDDDASPEKDR